MFLRNAEKNKMMFMQEVVIEIMSKELVLMLRNVKASYVKVWYPVS